MAVLSEDVFYVAAPYCPAAQPCIGREQVRRRLVEPLIERKTQIVATGQAEGSDSAARVRLEISWPGIEKFEVQRIVGYDEVKARGGQITTIHYERDLSDAQTAAFVKASAAAAAAAAAGPTVKVQ